jgi:hypothetical protein
MYPKSQELIAWVSYLKKNVTRFFLKTKYILKYFKTFIYCEKNTAAVTTSEKIIKRRE